MYFFLYRVSANDQLPSYGFTSFELNLLQGRPNAVINFAPNEWEYAKVPEIRGRRRTAIGNIL